MPAERYVPVLKKKYVEEIVPAFMKIFDLKNVMEVPRLVKISINRGFGCAKGDKKKIALFLKELTDISGQKCVETKAKKSVSNFNVREGMSIGGKVTLRGNRCFDFLYELINIVLPRIRDFSGVRKDAFDECGIYNLGLREQTIFPEVSLNEVTDIFGMNISIETSTKDVDKAFVLLKLFGMPFKI